MTEPRRHALSFDVEEFFHVANLRHAFPKERWDEVPSRLDVGMDALLSLLDKRGARATMFFLGWVAVRRPDLVKRCHDAGHEIASHGWEHEFLWDLEGPDGFREHLSRTEDAIEAAGVPRPVGFRASTFTLTRRTWWAFDVLAERGYLYDSSVHPVRHPTYGVPDFEPGISTVETGSGSIIEFPVTTLPLGSKNVPIGGGVLPALPRAAASRGDLTRHSHGPAGRDLPSSVGVRPGPAADPRAGLQEVPCTTWASRRASTASTRSFAAGPSAPCERCSRARVR